MRRRRNRATSFRALVFDIDFSIVVPKIVVAIALILMMNLFDTNCDLRIENGFSFEL